MIGNALVGIYRISLNRVIEIWIPGVELNPAFIA